MRIGRRSLDTVVPQTLDSGHAYSAVGDIGPTGLTAGTEYSDIPANPGYAFNQTRTGRYFFSERGAFRTDDVCSTDLGITYEIGLGGILLLVKPAIPLSRATLVQRNADSREEGRYLPDLQHNQHRCLRSFQVRR